MPGSSDNSKPLLNFEQPILPLEERQTLLFFRATCLPILYMYPNQTRISTGKVHLPSGIAVESQGVLHLRAFGCAYRGP